MGLPTSVDAVVADFQRSKSLPPDLDDAGATSEPEPERDQDEKSGDEEPLSEGEHDRPRRGDQRDGKGTGWGRWWRRGGGAKNRTQSVDVRQVQIQPEQDDRPKTIGRPRSGSGIERPALREIESSPVLPVRPINVMSSTVRPDSHKVTKLDAPLHVETPAAAPPIHVSEQAEEPQRRYAKTLRLSSDQLVCAPSLSSELELIKRLQESLDLKPGANTLTFSLSATGNVACTANIYLWEHTDHIVVSDIDGTITKYAHLSLFVCTRR